jgi:hypothetical protein
LGIEVDDAIEIAEVIYISPNPEMVGGATGLAGLNVPIAATGMVQLCAVHRADRCIVSCRPLSVVRFFGTVELLI